MSSSNPAETYERHYVPAVFAPCARQLIDLAGPRPGERVLDVACGTGIVARLAAPRVAPGGAVTGLDSTPPMLAVARAAAEREGLSIAWHEGRAEALPFADGSFDLVLCQLALMFFTDRQAAVAEMQRVLAPGGRVAVSVAQEAAKHPLYAEMHEALQRRLGVSGIADIFSFGDAGALRDLLAGAGLRGVEVAPMSVEMRFPDPEEFLGMEIAISAASVPSLQHLDAEQRRAATEAIRDDMAATLRAHTQGAELVIPFHVNVARGEKAAE